MTMNQLETACMTYEPEQFISMCINFGWLQRTMSCISCDDALRFIKNKRSPDNYSWRCYNKNCRMYKIYVSVRCNSFFEQFTIDIRKIVRIIAKYGNRERQVNIISSLDVGKNTVKRIISALVDCIPECDFSNDKLGGPGYILQADETMGNHSIKNHRGRAPENRTDFFTMVETINGRITRGFARIIPNKAASTLIPIIQSQALVGSTIHTDEHASYRGLTAAGYHHGTVCHKIEFVNRMTNVNTQAVESFNNCIKLEIKMRKGVRTVDRADFLREFLFYFNNKTCFLTKVMNLLKI